jgi:hypothetical protein
VGWDARVIAERGLSAKENSSVHVIPLFPDMKNGGMGLLNSVPSMENRILH